MLLRIIVISIVISLLSSLSYAADENADFERFKNQQTQDAIKLQKEFDQYKKELEEGFADYKKAYKKAVQAEKKSVKRVWGDYRPGDKKSWVQYEKGGVRKSVNFDTGMVELEMIVDEKSTNKRAEDALKKKFFELLKTSRRDAFESDNVAQAVEKRIAKRPQVKTAPVADIPVMSTLIPDVDLKNESQVKVISEKLISQAETDTRTAIKPGKKVVRVKFKIPTDIPSKSRQFIKTAKLIADKETLPLTLVMAVMETESAFNPMAKSGVPAYGLMQIVPVSAGQDATAYLFGKAKILSPSYLYNSENNIELGGAYLHILYYRYLKRIEDPVSRLYCTIAAYNTGAGNVAKAFTGKMNINRAARKINKLTPKQVYQTLRKKLPYKETRHYVKSVSRKMQSYQGI